MAARRIVYLASLLLAVAFFWAYREWLSWLILMLVVFLPWLSLLLSLPAMLCMRVGVDCPVEAACGTEVFARLRGINRLPLPPFRGKLFWQNCMTGNGKKFRAGTPVPTEHCGCLLLSPKSVWVYDYLGLIGLPVLRKETAKLMVRPEPVAPDTPPDLTRHLATAWKPKVGGGFAENHELRLYRPGDNLRQLHWKLSAKTGKLILREPMEPLRSTALLTLELSGTPEELDRKLGRFLWTSQYLLYRGVVHLLQCRTGNGMEEFVIKIEPDAEFALRSILASPCVGQGEGQFREATWSYAIGGEHHEA